MRVITREIMKIVRSLIIENKFIVRNATIKGGGGGRMNGERFLPTSTLYCIERNFARLYLMEFNFLFSGHSPHFIVRSTFSQFCFWRDIRQTFQILNFYLARRFFFLLFFFFFHFRTKTNFQLLHSSWDIFAEPASNFA